MERTITVRGTGTLRRKPDWIEIGMTLKSLDRDYAESAEKAAAQLDALRKTLCAIGFSEDALKTENFYISTEHESKQDKNGHFRNVFKGYACRQGLKLEFPFDTGRLSEVISAISACTADPELNVSFTIHDREKAADELLVSAAANARQKAETLTKAAGVRLGALISIDYHCGTLDFESPTGFLWEKRAAVRATAMELDMDPEDVELNDSATFVWELC